MSLYVGLRLLLFALIENEIKKTLCILGANIAPSTELFTRPSTGACDVIAN